MRIIVNDSSALIDLKKGGLLEALTALPFEFVVSDAILADELLSFTKREITVMRRNMRVATLDGAEIRRVSEFQRQSPALSFHDCVALLIAQREQGCILLTGDRRLRARAIADKLECHGVLWLVAEMEKAKAETPRNLIKALETWRADFTVRLPKEDIAHAISRLKR
jgi:predicted nucleic acid-binding protein